MIHQWCIHLQNTSDFSKQSEWEAARMTAQESQHSEKKYIVVQPLKLPEYVIDLALCIIFMCLYQYPRIFVTRSLFFILKL